MKLARHAQSARHLDEGAGVRVFFLVCALLNGAAAVGMVSADHSYAWRLMPGEAQDDAWYRR